MKLMLHFYYSGWCALLSSWWWWSAIDLSIHDHDHTDLLSIYLCLGILSSSSTTIVSSISQRRGCTLSWSTAPKVGVLMQLTSYRRWQLKWYDAASFFNPHYDNKLSTVSLCMIVVVELLIWTISIVLMTTVALLCL
jgi:hypothetical protein